jgi:hypothetical protein
MSNVGVIIFHDINVFERGFGVWRLWEELRSRYPAYGFAHQHGLGIIYVGCEPHPFATLCRMLTENRNYAKLAQAAFEAIGQLLIEHRANVVALDQQSAAVVERNEPQARIAALEQGNAELSARLGHLQSGFDAVVNSSSWRATAPLRSLLNYAPALRRFVRRSAKLCWWMLSRQHVGRIR